MITLGIITNKIPLKTNPATEWRLGTNLPVQLFQFDPLILGFNKIGAPCPTNLIRKWLGDNDDENETDAQDNEGDGDDGSGPFFKS